MRWTAPTLSVRPLPMTAEVQEIFQWLHNHEGGQKDHSAIAQYYEYLTGIQIGRPDTRCKACHRNREF